MENKMIALGLVLMSHSMHVLLHESCNSAKKLIKVFTCVVLLIFGFICFLVYNYWRGSIDWSEHWIKLASRLSNGISSPKCKNDSVHGSRPIGLQKIQILISLIHTLEHQITTNLQAKDEENAIFKKLVSETLPKCQIKIPLVTYNYLKTQKSSAFAFLRPSFPFIFSNYLP